MYFLKLCLVEKPRYAWLTMWIEGSAGLERWEMNGSSELEESGDRFVKPRSQTWMGNGQSEKMKQQALKLD